ncbi:hypothetical protein AAMO2058_000850600 [Amorphochlora amoebiformis]
MEILSYKDALDRRNARLCDIFGMITVQRDYTWAMTAATGPGPEKMMNKKY